MTQLKAGVTDESSISNSNEYIEELREGIKKRKSVLLTGPSPFLPLPNSVSKLLKIPSFSGIISSGKITKLQEPVGDCLLKP